MGKQRHTSKMVLKYFNFPFGRAILLASFFGFFWLLSRIVNLNCNFTYDLDDKERTHPSLQSCKTVKTKFVGRIPVDRKAVPSLVALESILSPNISSGGIWRPINCQQKHKVAIIVPFRDRQDHLLLFLQHMHRFLQNQNLEYGIFIIEQSKEESFNRGALFNVGFQAAVSRRFECFVFHDVDSLPLDDRILYTCPEYPKHLSVAMEKYKYRLPYADYIGGVLAMSKQHFELVNGFSNFYFGWGGEDDDMFKRLQIAKLPVERLCGNVSAYASLHHFNAPKAIDRKSVLQTAAQRMSWDGLKSLEYTTQIITISKLFTKITVILDKTRLRQNSTKT